MKEFLMFFLVNWGVMVVLYKYKIKELLKKPVLRILHNISECEFCLEHHVGVIVLFIYMIVSVKVFSNDVVWLELAFPFMSTSLSNLIKRVISR